jgi:hypothetical protein
MTYSSFLAPVLLAVEIAEIVLGCAADAAHRPLVLAPLRVLIINPSYSEYPSTRPHDGHPPRSVPNSSPAVQKLRARSTFSTNKYLSRGHHERVFSGPWRLLVQRACRRFDNGRDVESVQRLGMGGHGSVSKTILRMAITDCHPLLSYWTIMIHSFISTNTADP